MSVRILIADDHRGFRRALRALLEKETDFEVVAETGSGRETLQAAVELEIDVVVLDPALLDLPDRHIVGALVEARPEVAMVVLARYEDELYLRELMKMGARNFVLKRSTGARMVQAVRAAHRGEHYIDPILGGKLLSTSWTGRPPHQGAAGFSALTLEEREICRFLVRGYTDAEIATRLWLSPNDVESSRSSIMAKLGLKTRSDLVRFAAKTGLF